MEKIFLSFVYNYYIIYLLFEFKFKKFIRRSDFDKSTVILRFLGTTNESSTISNTFISIIKQLNQIYSTDLQSKNNSKYLKDLNLNELTHMLKEMLIKIKNDHADHKIFIFLDAIEQLNKNDYNMSWLFTNLASNTKAIYSVLANHQADLLPNLILKIKNEKNLLEIKPLEIEEAERLIEKRLIINDKDLTHKQKRNLKKLLKKATYLSHLYLNLVYEIVSKWYSFDEEDSNDLSKCNSIEKCIDYIFDVYEKVHGRMFVQKFVFYINHFGETGVSERELVDVLTLDDEILQDLYRKYLPSVIRFPLLIWKRFQSEIKSLWTVKHELDLDLMQWSHIQFLQCTQIKYAFGIRHNSSRSDMNENNEASLPSNISHTHNLFNIYHFFKETYRKNNHEKRSLFVLNHSTSHIIESCRSTMSQRMITLRRTVNQLKKMNPNSVLFHVNKRKLYEFPRLIFKFENQCDLLVEELKRNIFFNFKFIYSIVLIDDMQFLRAVKDNLLDLHAKMAVQAETPNPIESIIVFYLTLDECFRCSLLSDEPASFLFVLRSRLIDYCLFNEETHMLDFFSYSAAIHFNKSLR